MIIEEVLTNNLVKHYSDNGKYILQNVNCYVKL